MFVVKHPNFEEGQWITKTVNHLVSSAFAVGTMEKHNSNLRKFYRFAVSNRIWKAGWMTQPSEKDMVFFVGQMANEGLKAGTIKGTLSGVAAALVNLGFKNPCKDFMGNALPLLRRVVRGVSRTHGGPRRVRKALTIDKLEKILPHVHAAVGGSLFDAACVKSAMCQATNQLLRVSEFTCKKLDAAQHDPKLQLNEEDVSIDECVVKQGRVKFLDTWIKVSKADPFRNGAKLRVAANGSASCPVAAVESYVRIRGGRGAKSPFYLMEDGTALTRQGLQLFLRRAMESAGYAPHEYGTHSFRIGGVTSLAAAGWGTEVIQVMGRYASDAFLAYLRITDTLRMEASSSMAAISDQDVIEHQRRRAVPAREDTV